ncbi:MAG: ABC transporter ATP-binding protein [Gammaproteobacteria bacterium]|nr:ABC transporter ATP-binding protein [Gammaproteobacteria bacterium]MDH3405962.1 ABC transporter ATP-binding protein [Gammaproteobacteria bacterium]
MTGNIIVHGLGKKFRLYHPDRPSKLKQVFARKFRNMEPAGEFWAIRQVSLEVTPGHMVGLIGHNGAGKSTLLRLIGGVGIPDEGSVNTRGRISALLDLGAECHPDLTGRDNVFLSGVISGLTRREVVRSFDSIVTYAELEEFIDNPFRTYSSGMKLRLAFSVAIHTGPDILLIDEVLSVGDAAFQKKCLQSIEEFKANGCAILLVSHEMDPIQRFCDEVLWFQYGQILAHGPPDTICAQYQKVMTGEASKSDP